MYYMAEFESRRDLEIRKKRRRLDRTHDIVAIRGCRMVESRIRRWARVYFTPFARALPCRPSLCSAIVCHLSSSLVTDPLLQRLGETYLLTDNVKLALHPIIMR
jgi:hypothetical protein